MGKVLVIDDSEDLLDFLSFLLRLDGYEVRVEPAYKDLLAAVSSFKPDVILLDVMLGGKDGREICFQIRQTDGLSTIPVILMSASPNYLNDYDQYGAVDTIEKPFTMKTVAMKINAAINSAYG